MASNKKYRRSIEELQDQTLTEKLAANEFAEKLPVDEFLGDESVMESGKTSRRDFLKLLGFSTAAATLAACEAPVIKSIPYVVKPIEVTPGVPTYYASTMFDGYDYASVLVKTREGRPIRIDANRQAKYFGDTNARVQASVLSLYDSYRLKDPKIKGEKVAWDDLDMHINGELSKISGKKIVIMTPSLPSPSTRKILEQFKQKYPNTEQVVFDAYDYSPALDAAQEVYGKRVLPHYNLSNSELVVSFNADFLADWNAGGLESSYAAARKPGKSMLRHIQVESNLSLTGGNADTRFPLKQSAVMKTLADVYQGVTGGSASTATGRAIVEELKAKGSKAVVFADGNKEAYLLSYLINQALRSSALTGKSILLKESNSAKFETFVADAVAGNVGALFVYGTNPLYAYHDTEKLNKAFAKIGLKVSMVEKENETSEAFEVQAPIHHWLESWGDIMPLDGVYSLQQPTIQPLFNTRQFQDSLLKWSAGTVTTVVVPEPSVTDSTAVEAPKTVAISSEETYYDYLKKFAESVIASSGKSFNQALYDGFVEIPTTESLTAAGGDGASAVAKLSSTKASEWELQIYTKVGAGDGKQNTNPWLLELPDPITRTSWDNYITMNPADAKALGIEMWNGGNERTGRMSFNGSYYNVTVNGKTIKAPVYIQPGQAKGTIGLALGYGVTGKVAEANDLEQIGINIYPFFQNGITSLSNVTLEKAEGEHHFANIQMMNTLMGRYEIARDTTLEEFLHGDPDEWNEKAVMGTHEGEKRPAQEVDLWRSHDRAAGLGPHFKLSIDLNSCTGCGACVIACQAENNTPVVGKEEIRRSRDMYWLRIDRYYSDAIEAETGEKYTQKAALKDETRTEVSQYTELVIPAEENPDVIFQPMLCQHCNHAPCETVCPVAATSHGRQGQNQMAYNRCVGTRYCANNCPYKVRRFNWFNYAQNDKFDFNMNNDLGRMVLNPDVVVRQRGVMEKCSFCIQETQATILKAKREGRKVKEEEWQSACACANACSSGAMVFGDVNDEGTTITELEKDNRKYEVLEEVGTQPNVFYHVKVRNRK